jgi:hypothetical protein
MSKIRWLTGGPATSQILSRFSGALFCYLVASRNTNTFLLSEINYHPHVLLSMQEI